MTKQQIIKLICEKYHDIMLITHDEMLDMKKKDLENYLKQLQNKKKKNTFAFGIDETRCESGKFNSVEELLESAQSSWDEMDGNPFDEDCEYSGVIWVGVVEDFEPASFAPTLDWVADYMTDEFYGNYNIDDDSDVTINNKKEAGEAWKEFVNKYFEMPCNWAGMWFGIYNLKEHCWKEKFDNFKKYVKDE